MSDTMRAVRARWALHDRRWAPLPLKRYAPRPWWPVHPWGYYAGPGRRRPLHVASIGPTMAGKTPAGASVFELSPDGRRLTLVRQP